MPGKGEMKIETQEVEAAVPELEPLINPTDDEIDEMMGMLGYDALNDSTPENMHDRGEQMKKSKLRQNFLRAGKHGELFALRGQGERIIGLLGLRANAPEGIGYVTLLRTATRETTQFGITEKLLIAAEHYLRQSPRNCTRGVLQGRNPSERVQAAARHGDRATFWEVEETESSEKADEGENPLESGQ